MPFLRDFILQLNEMPARQTRTRRLFAGGIPLAVVLLLGFRVAGFGRTTDYDVFYSDLNADQSRIVKSAAVEPALPAKELLVKEGNSEENPPKASVPLALNPGAADPAWPVPTAYSRPWTRWWWPDSAVDKAGITANLEAFARAGFGGVEVEPIGHLADPKVKRIPYMSPEWVNLLVHASREARRLGMRIDLGGMGTGWSFGGPWIPLEDASVVVDIPSWRLSRDQRLQDPVGPERRFVEAVMAYSAEGKIENLTARLDPSARLDWAAPSDGWTLYAVVERRDTNRVREATPGGSGYVVDHFSAKSFAKHLAHFDQPLAAVSRADAPGAVFYDSWESFMNWTGDLFDQFERRRGYDLRLHLPEMCGKGPDKDSIRRVQCDYRETLNELFMEGFLLPWREWAARHGMGIRMQAIGVPANEIDVFAANAIPEADMGGPPSWYFESPGVYAPKHLFRRAFLPASAAHLAGRPLVSAETLTLMGPPLSTPMEMCKENVDYNFVGGVNHILYHGVCYSPPSAPWPGWLSPWGTHLEPTTPAWRSLPAFNIYVTRCQSMLQQGNADCEALFYFPTYDYWSAELDRTVGWGWRDGYLFDFPPASIRLWQQGYAYDFTSDALLRDAVTVEQGRLAGRAGSYRVLVVADCRLIPVQTFRRIVELARQGATVVVAGESLADVPGLGRLDERRRQFKEIKTSLGQASPLEGDVTELRIGSGRILTGPDLGELMRASGARREACVDYGVQFIRRADRDGWTYFFVNPTARRLDQWVALSVSGPTAALFDPASGRVGLAATRPNRQRSLDVYLQIEPRQACLLKVYRKPVNGRAWAYLAPAGEPVALKGDWQVEFIVGGPRLPAPRRLSELSSWTSWGGGQAELLRNFSGTARYTLAFDAPAASATDWLLDLGEALDHACVSLNGRDLGVCFARPFRLRLSSALRPGRNTLRVEVTNFMSNRAADLARRENLTKLVFGWGQADVGDLGQAPLPSGLLGPVTLTPLKLLEVK